MVDITTLTKTQRRVLAEAAAHPYLVRQEYGRWRAAGTSAMAGHYVCGTHTINTLERRGLLHISRGNRATITAAGLQETNDD